MDKHHVIASDHDLASLLDYAVVDTARWLSGIASLDKRLLLTNDAGEIILPSTIFSQSPARYCMHRRAEAIETVQAVTDVAPIDITDMPDGVRRGQGVVNKPIPGWQSTLDSVVVGCARRPIGRANQVAPQTAGEQAVLAQRIVDKIWRDAMVNKPVTSGDVT